MSARVRQADKGREGRAELPTQFIKALRKAHPAVHLSGRPALHPRSSWAEDVALGRARRALLGGEVGTAGAGAGTPGLPASCTLAEGMVSIHMDRGVET